MNKAIGFIGLGVMGSPMAGHLSNHHEIRVFNRSLEKTKSWIKKYSGSECSSVKEISKVSDILFLCVGNDNDLREVTFGENGVFKNIQKGAVYIDNTTASATIAREIHEYAKKMDLVL